MLLWNFSYRLPIDVKLMLFRVFVIQEIPDKHLCLMRNHSWDGCLPRFGVNMLAQCWRTPVACVRLRPIRRPRMIEGEIKRLRLN